MLLHPAISMGQVGGISLDHVDGEISSGTLMSGVPIVFHLRITQDFPGTVDGSSNGFEIYSPDGAQWQPHFYADTTIGHFPIPFDTVIDSTYYGRWVDPPALAPLVWNGSDPQIYDGGIFVQNFPTHPVGWPISSDTDTIGFTGFLQQTGTGIVNGFDELGWTLTIDSFTQSSVGKTICLDSAWFPPSGRWVWSRISPDTNVFPSWDGPHCFEIVASCCVGMRGNTNFDFFDQIDITDLTYLVAWMFGSGAAPPRMLEADVNGDAIQDIADLTYLVAYRFAGGPSPAACP